MPPEIFKIILQELLQALDYLYTEFHVIHTGESPPLPWSKGAAHSETPDSKPDNIMVRLEDRELLTQDTRDELENALPQKHCDDGRIIYLSRRSYGPLKG